MKLKKQARQEAIKNEIERNPFITDNALNDSFRPYAIEYS